MCRRLSWKGAGLPPTPSCRGWRRPKPVKGALRASLRDGFATLARTRPPLSAGLVGAGGRKVGGRTAATPPPANLCSAAQDTGFFLGGLVAAPHTRWSLRREPPEARGRNRRLHNQPYMKAQPRMPRAQRLATAECPASGAQVPRSSMNLHSSDATNVTKVQPEGSRSHTPNTACPVRARWGGRQRGATVACGSWDVATELHLRRFQDREPISSKLATRVRIPSPAPTAKVQVGALFPPGLAFSHNRYGFRARSLRRVLQELSAVQLGERAHHAHDARVQVKGRRRLGPWRGPASGRPERGAGVPVTGRTRWAAHRDTSARPPANRSYGVAPPASKACATVSRT